MALPDVPAGLSSDVLLERPDVRQAEQQLIAANADIGAARAAFFPTITLTGSYGTASTELSGLFDHQAWTFIPQVTLPIFDAGRNRNNLRVSEAQRDIATAQYEKAVQSAFRDVADALAGRATLVDQLAAQQAETDAEAERFKLSNMLFTNGVAELAGPARRAALAVRVAAVAGAGQAGAAAEPDRGLPRAGRRLGGGGRAGVLSGPRAQASRDCAREPSAHRQQHRRCRPARRCQQQRVDRAGEHGAQDRRPTSGRRRSRAWPRCRRPARPAAAGRPGSSGASQIARNSRNQNACTCRLNTTCSP